MSSEEEAKSLEPILLGEININKIMTAEGDVRIIFRIEGDVPLDAGLGMLEYTKFMILANNTGVLG